MKGVVFRYLSNFVTENYGYEAWLQGIEQSDLETPEGVYVGPGEYPDSDLFALVGTFSEMTKIAVPDLVYAFGKFLFHGFHKDFPHFFVKPKNTKELLLSIQDVIHVEVRKLHPGAKTPKFTYEDPGEGKLIMHYDSPRKICFLARGLMEEAGKVYNEKVEVEETQCVHQGAEHCVFSITFSGGD